MSINNAGLGRNENRKTDVALDSTRQSGATRSAVGGLSTTEWFALRESAALVLQAADARDSRAQVWSVWVAIWTTEVRRRLVLCDKSAARSRTHAGAFKPVTQLRRRDLGQQSRIRSAKRKLVASRVYSR